MQPHEYQTLYEFETVYWWYRGIHGMLLDTLRSLHISPEARLLDAGCGTGQNLVNVKECVTADVYGFDFSTHAAAFWSKRGLDSVCVASINEIPFPAETFDVVTSVDVFECEAVDEEAAYAQLWNVLKPGGFLILVVPAYDWLLNPEHHDAVGAVRRYSRPKLGALLRKRPVQVIRVTHLFASVFPAVAGYRVLDRWLPRRSDGPPQSDLKPLHPTVNRLLRGVVNAERKMLRHWDMPFGSSIMAVARKEGQ